MVGDVFDCVGGCARVIRSLGCGVGTVLGMVACEAADGCVCAPRAMSLAARAAMASRLAKSLPLSVEDMMALAAVSARSACSGEKKKARSCSSPHEEMCEKESRSCLQSAAAEVHVGLIGNAFLLLTRKARSRVAASAFARQEQRCATLLELRKATSRAPQTLPNEHVRAK